jgi:hypothetical protein
VEDGEEDEGDVAEIDFDNDEVVFETVDGRGDWEELVVVCL